MEFIARLIQHIPEKHFKQIRYYGLYARHRESDKKIRLAIAKEKEEFFFPLIVGEILPLPLLAMIRLHVLVAARSCFFLNSTIIISIFL